MNFLSLFTLFISFVTTSYAVSDNSVEHRFLRWLDNFKIRIKSTNHFYDIFEKWKENDIFIDNVNSQRKSYKLAHNQFSGMNSTEYIELISNKFIHKAPVNIIQDTLRKSSPPSEVDWVSDGAVTPVKDQGQCGSCWSFSTTGALEGAYFVKYGKLVSFSEEQLVDCDNWKNGGHDHGCNGGLMDNAFTWINGNGGLCSEFDYPYISQDGSSGQNCQTQCDLVKGSQIVDLVDVPPSNDQEMMSAIALNPVSVAIEADQREFQLYSSGVFTGECGTNLDHGVLTVGYGTENGEDYYLVKNSWSSSWGDNGFIKLGKGSQYNNGQGQCGILLQASYPLL